MNRLVAAMIYLIVVSGLAGGVWFFALTSGLESLAERGRADLSVASARLQGQLQRFRELAVFLSDHPDIIALLDGRGTAQQAQVLLREAADKTGSPEILTVAPGGVVLASSSGTYDPLPVTTALSRALDGGALGAEHGVAADGMRTYSFSAPVFSDRGPVRGAVVVRANVVAIEGEWRGDAMTVAFTDEFGVVFASNRSELIYLDRSLPGHSAPAVYANAGANLQPFPEIRSRQVAGVEIWQLDAGRYVPGRAIHLVQPLPVIEMTGEALVDIAPALRMAWLQALATAAAGLVVGALMLVLVDRRRALAERLTLEAAANARLEQRVKERTSALSAANLALRREVDERTLAEAALKKAQDDLVLAGKLSALGQMSAGISHELNQPLMAISSFADNGEAFLERGKPEKVSENLSRISEMAGRMGRIIRNLRAFARQEVQPVRAVDIGRVVEDVLELAQGRLRREGVTLDWQVPPSVVWVRGGDVRLQQVVMNLVSNAIEAMEGSAEKQLTIRVEPGAPVLLRVADTGCGIAATDRMFDPFYSTKEVGKSEGMGLGLSISYGIVQSFGGVIRGANGPGGGAVFTVELEPTNQEVAA